MSEGQSTPGSGQEGSSLISEVQNLPFFRQLEEYKQFFEGFYNRFQKAGEKILSEARQYSSEQLSNFAKTQGAFIQSELKRLRKETDEKVDDLRKEMRTAFDTDLIGRVRDMLDEFREGKLDEILKRLDQHITGEYKGAINAYDERLGGRLKKLGEAYKTGLEKTNRTIESLRERIHKIESAGLTEEQKKEMEALVVRYTIVPAGDMLKREEIAKSSDGAISIPDDIGEGVATVVPESIEEKEARRRRIGYYRSEKKIGRADESNVTKTLSNDDSAEKDAEEFEKLLKANEEGPKTSDKKPDSSDDETVRGLLEDPIIPPEDIPPINEGN